MTDHRCADFEPVWQAVLDRELPVERLHDAAGCPHCEFQATFARHLLGYARLPGEVTGVTVSQVLAQAARRTKSIERGTLAALLAIAAALLIGVSTIPPERPPQNVEVAVVPIPTTPPTVRVSDLFAEARASFPELPAIDLSTTPTTNSSVPTLALSEGMPAEIGDLRGAAKLGFEPIADSTWQAVDYFRREAGLSSRQKS